MAESPWSELARLEDVVFDRADLPAGIEAIRWSDGRRTVILLDRALLRPERRAALAHELEHHRRGGGPPVAWLAAKDERQVDDRVARRLVPADELLAVAARRCGGLMLWEIAEEFDVPESVARRAVELLREDP